MSRNSKLEQKKAMASDLRKIIEETKINDCEKYLNYLTKKSEVNDKESEDDNEKKGPKSTWRLITMIVLNGMFFFVELVVGIITHSLSLQSDAFNMLSDEASVVIGLVVHKISKRKPTSKMSFGYARAETVGGLCNAVFMYAVALTIFLNAIELFTDPRSIEHSLIFLVVGGLGLLVNLIGMIIFNDHEGNDNIKGVFLHAMGDFMGSVGVLISALVQNFTTWSCKDYVDPFISIIIAIILVVGTTGLFKKTTKMVVEMVPDDIDFDDIKNALLKIPNVIDIHDFHIWGVAENVNMAVAHILVNSFENRKEVMEKANNIFIVSGVYSLTIQIECIKDFFNDDFEEGQKNHCAFSSAVGKDNRIFLSTPSYLHLVGCEHHFHRSITDDCLKNLENCTQNSMTKDDFSSHSLEENYDTPDEKTSPCNCEA